MLLHISAMAEQERRLIWPKELEERSLKKVIALSGSPYRDQSRLHHFMFSTYRVSVYSMYTECKDIPRSIWSLYCFYNIFVGVCILNGM